MPNFTYLAVFMAASLCLSTTSAFVQQQSSVSRATSSKLHVSNIPTEPTFTEVPYGEDSRKFRRTVYSHDDWVRDNSNLDP